MAELKPCPFCGGKAHIYRTCGYSPEEIIFVGCENCEASATPKRMISFNPDDDERKAIEAWNRRADNG